MSLFQIWFIYLSTKKALHRLYDTYKRWLTYVKKMTSQTRRQRPGGHEILGFRGCPAPDRYTPRSPLERRTGYAADCPEPADSRPEVIFILQSFQYVIHLILHLLGCFLYLYWIEQLQIFEKGKGGERGLHAGLRRRTQPVTLGVHTLPGELPGQPTSNSPSNTTPFLLASHIE